MVSDFLQVSSFTTSAGHTVCFIGNPFPSSCQHVYAPVNIWLLHCNDTYSDPPNASLKPSALISPPTESCNTSGVNNTPVKFNPAPKYSV